MHLSAFKFQSTKITLAAIVAINALTTANLIAELTIDLETTTTGVMVLFWAVSVGMLLIYLKWPNWSVIPGIITSFAYLLLELIFFTNAKSFHTINFWLVFVPIAALILQGVRASLIWAFIVLATFLFNAYRIEYLFEGRYDIVVRKEPFLITHYIFFFGILASVYLLHKLLGDAYENMRKKNEELDRLRQNLTEKKQRLENYQQSIIALNRDEALIEDDIQAINHIVCTAAKKQLSVSRVSIWVLNGTMLERKCLQETSGATDAIVTLHTNDYPAYFNALHNKPVIMADDATVHEDTREFAEGYLKPLHIVSMMDCPIKIGGKTIGVICCEQQQTQRHWQPEDALFVQSLADIMAMCHQNERIKNLLRQIRHQNHELIEKTNSIETMNEELTSLNEELISLNDQLTGTNERLELAVKKRTEELESQNKQLTEYAFINSHLLRAPLARLLGISHLVAMEVSTVKDKELLEALQVSARELDEIVKKISELLYAGHPMSREDINAIVDKNFAKLN
ncbi:MAG: GAF domain-containing protein [Flammeovirgaceae bacterium]|nr:MAG: GAF domain-containing protein [Flammeovirgaceae bacterium]